MRCDCCDLPVESCGKAIEDRQRAEAHAERERLLTLPGVIAADLAGRCARCHGRVEVGDPIRHERGQGWHGWRDLLCCPL